MSNICYCKHKAEVMTSRGDFHPRGLIGKLLYLLLANYQARLELPVICPYRAGTNYRLSR